MEAEGRLDRLFGRVSAKMTGKRMRTLKLLELLIFYNLAVSLLFGAWLWLLRRRRDLWLRWLAVEEAFWARRLRIPPRFAVAYRRFAEGRAIIGWAAGFLAISLLLFLLSLGVYFHFADKLR